VVALLRNVFTVVDVVSVAVVGIHLDRFERVSVTFMMLHSCWIWIWICWMDLFCPSFETPRDLLHRFFKIAIFLSKKIDRRRREPIRQQSVANADLHSSS